MSLVTESWRLKLLALGLSVLMLGAVAFSQNPPTFRTLTIGPLQYTNPGNLVVINAPTKTTVRVTGLADTIQSLTASSLVGTFDLSKATTGPAVKVNLVITPLDKTVTVQNPSVPFALDIDSLKSVPLTVQVRAPRVASGWVVTTAEAKCPNNPCVVNFSGPAGWETNLKAYADITAPVDGDFIRTPNVPVTLEQAGIPLEPTSFSKTVPVSGLDINGVEVDITAKTSTTSKQVVLYDVAPSHLPPSGYHVIGITVDPIAVLITGKADVLAKVQNLALPALDLSGQTSSVTFRVTIPYPAGVSGSVAIARVTYTIVANPSVQVTPSPTPSP